jgi:hypothetical protein
VKCIVMTDITPSCQQPLHNIDCSVVDKKTLRYKHGSRHGTMTRDEKGQKYGVPFNWTHDT